MATVRVLVVALFLVALPPAVARGGAPFDPNLNVDPSLRDCSVVFAPDLTQDAYHRFVREFGSVSAFKQAAAPTPLGRRGLSVDLEALFFSVEEKSAAWNDTFAHPDGYHPLGSSKQFPKLRLRYGVTDDLEVGAFYAANFDANYGWLGLDAKYGVLRQGEDMPISLAVRGAYTKTLYVTDMNMQAVTADVSVGRTFWKVFTPYVGVGTDAVLARETSDVVSLDTEAVVVPHALAGLELRYWHVAVGVEAQRSALTSYEAHLSATF